MLILDLWGISFYIMVVFGLDKNLLFKSILGHCADMDKAEPVYEGRLTVILLLQVSRHDLEPTFIILVLIPKILPDQPK